MNKFFLKVKNKIKSTFKEFKADYRFSFYYALLRFFQNFFSTIRMYKLSSVIRNKRYDWMISFLKNNIKKTISFNKNNNNSGVPSEEKQQIWVCWWTGEDSAPQLVKKCIKSIKNNSPKYNVNFIDKDTYTKYITIPEYMLKKINDNKMLIAHLCDYIRVSLLEKYGGIWLDATIYCTEQLPIDYFNMPVFTCKSVPTECGYLSKKRWVTFVLGGWKQNVFYKFLKDAFEEYWEKYDYAIDYLFFDALIEIARQENSTIRSLLDDIPINNLNRDDLQKAFNDNLISSEFNNIIKKDTILYKLSWREQYKLLTDDGKESIYSYFLNNN